MFYESQHELTDKWWSAAPAVFCEAIQLHPAFSNRAEVLGQHDSPGNIPLCSRAVLIV